MALKTNFIDVQMAQAVQIDPETFDLESWEPNQLEIEFEPDFDVDDDEEEGEFFYRLIIENKHH
jgi:hypothetical protein